MDIIKKQNLLSPAKYSFWSCKITGPLVFYISFLTNVFGGDWGRKQAGKIYFCWIEKS